MVNDLPERGTGLRRGTASDRRVGVPRTDEERLERHKQMTAEENDSVEESKNRLRMLNWGTVLFGVGAFAVGYYVARKQKL